MAAKRKSSKRARSKARVPRFSEKYSRFFVVNVSPMWRNESDNFSLDQPSPNKVVPSVTTYGIADAPFPVH